MYDPVPEEPFIESALYIEGKKLDVVHSFVYIGHMVVEGLSSDDISLCTEKASEFFSGFENVFGLNMASNSKKKSWSISMCFDILLVSK